MLSSKVNPNWIKVVILLILVRLSINTLDLEEQYTKAPRLVSLGYVLGNTMGLFINTVLACVIFEKFVCCLAISLATGYFLTYSIQNYAASLDGS